MYCIIVNYVFAVILYKQIMKNTRNEIYKDAKPNKKY